MSLNYYFYSNSNTTDLMINHKSTIDQNDYLTICDWFQMSSDFKSPLSVEKSKQKNQDLLPEDIGNQATSADTQQEQLSSLQWVEGNQS